MLGNPRSDRVRFVRSLARRQVRDREGLFLAEGPQSVGSAVTHRPELVRDLYVDAEAGSRHTGLVRLAAAAGLTVTEVSPQVLGAMADTESPQGVLAVCRIVRADLSDVLAAAPRLLVVLTNVRDPGNAGTAVRGADAAGADAVLVTAGSVDIHNPKVVRASAGSLFHLPVVTGMPVSEVLAALRTAGLRLLAADGAGTDVLGDPAVDAWLREPHAWVMGNEAWGLQEHARDVCDAVVRVPIHGLAESLNLAMAATVCLYASASVQRSAGAVPQTG